MISGGVDVPTVHRLINRPRTGRTPHVPDPQFPTVTQYASEDLIHAIVYEGRDPADDPGWAVSGAPDPDTP
ncbi:hypothetical protein ACFVGY_05985 [Streptomyces sp. NPDC127106]|uniref:hypothetical protein n=1 Tax=Streptomyces sp. NPDC127106 TaxID=3345360 RepID=UPI00362AFA34